MLMIVDNHDDNVMMTLNWIVTWLIV